MSASPDSRADGFYNQIAHLKEAVLQHLALTCSDYEAMKQRLEASKTKFREDSPAQGVKQLFVQDPSGITFELSFQES